MPIVRPQRYRGFAKVAGVKLNHYRGGNGQSLVLIHGIGSRWQMWEPVMDRLVASRDVIALDLPGFGASPMPPGGTPPGAGSLGSLVLEFLAGIGVERPHVAGNSIGGLIALQLAQRGDVRSASALSPVGFGNRPEMAGARGALWLGVRAARWLSPRAEAVLTPRAGRALALGLYVRRPDRVSADDATASIRALAGAPWFDATLPTLRPAAFDRGVRIDVPVTIAWGAQDRLLLPRQAQRAARAIPSARSVTLHGCGHVPTYDDPALVARVLLEGSSA